MAKYTKRTKEWWATHVATLKSSGLPLSVYATRHDLVESTLRDHVLRAKSETSSSLVPIPMLVIDPKLRNSSLSGLYLELQNGAKLQISNNFNTETFVRILLSINDL